MNNIIKLSSLYIIALIYCSACRDQSAEYKTINIEENYAECVAEEEIFSEVRYITLDSNTSVRNIIRVALDGDELYVCDEAQLLLFDDKGTYIRVIGSKGRGRGEYLSVADFAIGDSVIYILDNNKNIMLYSREDYHFIDKQTLPFYPASMSILENGDVALSSAYQQDTESKFHIYNPMITELVCELSPINEYENSYRHFKGQNNFFRHSGELLYVEPINNNIYGIDSDGIKIKYTINLFGLNPSESVTAKRYDSIIDLITTLNERGYAYGFPFFAEGQESLLFTFSKYGDFQMGLYDKKSAKSKQFSNIILYDGEITMSISDLMFATKSPDLICFPIQPDDGSNIIAIAQLI